MPARTVKPATDTAFQNCDCLDSITVLHKYSRKSSITPAHLEKGARGKEIQKGMSYRSCEFSLPQLKGTVEHESCPKLDGTLEISGQCAGVEGWSDGRQVCLLGFSPTMNQVKVSTDDHDQEIYVRDRFRAEASTLTGFTPAHARDNCRMKPIMSMLFTF